jgi:hypothetical protein
MAKDGPAVDSSVDGQREGKRNARVQAKKVILTICCDCGKSRCKCGACGVQGLRNGDMP